ncbi:hypothetical protein L6R52_40420, partial [Myxococcota bacterium]|nr:hypothetical protein [Myxococcota bacterium]
FLRHHKALLRLSLSATEDLLVNGAKVPDDRGTCKYLLSKIDRKTVEKALARDVLKNDAPLRSRFLAGVVRLNPEIAVLLWYLETLAEVADKRDAAAAFASTVDHIDFTAVSSAQMSTLLDVITRTFEGHDRIQALFGLLASETFAAALERSLATMAAELRATFAPLRAVHRVVYAGAQVPSDEDGRAELDRGIATWLAAPDRVIRSYPLEVRTRIAELVIHELDLSSSGTPVPRSLLDSLPHAEEAYARLGIARVEQLLAAHDDQAAKALLSQIVQSHPAIEGVKGRLEAMSWKRVGRVTIAPDEPAEPGEGSSRRRNTGRLRRGFWLDGSMFAWVKTAPVLEAGRLALEAQLQGGLVFPGVTPVLAHGVGDDGTAFVALAPGGRVLDVARLDRLTTPEVMALALEAVRILRGVAAAGLELPDAALARFLHDRQGLRLADFEGVKKQDAAGAAIAHGALARKLVAEMLAPGGEARAELPAVLKVKLAASTPLPVLARLLVEQTAKLVDPTARADRDAKPDAPKPDAPRPDVPPAT